jgi:hypothetical protein
VEYPPKPTPELQMASRMLELVKSGATGRESAHDEGEDDLSQLIGPELAVLPPEIFTHVLEFCSVRCLINLAATSSYW